MMVGNSEVMSQPSGTGPSRLGRGTEDYDKNPGPEAFADISEGRGEPSSPVARFQSPQSRRKASKYEKMGKDEEDDSVNAPSHEVSNSKFPRAASRRTPKAEMPGWVAILLSALLFSVMGMLVRSVKSYFSSTQSMFVRSSIQGTASLSFLLITGRPILGEPHVRCMVMWRGVVGAVANWCFFFALTQIPLGDANAIFFTAPIFTAIYTTCLTRENRISVMEGIAALISVAGLFLVSRPPFLFGDSAIPEEVEEPDVKGGTVPRSLAVGLCLLGAAGNGYIPVVVRGIPKDAVHWMALVFSFAACGFVLSGSALLFGFQEASFPAFAETGPWPYLGLLAIGCCASCGQGLWNMGCQREKPSLAAITRQMDVPFAFFWQISVFQATPVITSIMGAGLVLLSTTAVLGRKLLCTPQSAPALPAESCSEEDDAQLEAGKERLNTPSSSKPAQDSQ
mmetsp:Transcript_92149/g.201984  ORF Transcript_92149/g.201984 Transcript_92149/m.201984 type:complete len:452 (-) Transcript_92149:90-1445(-)